MDNKEACELVGRFLYYFAQVESEIDTSIIQILDLKSHAAAVISSGIDFSKKVNILTIISSETALPEDSKNNESLFKKIFKQNDNRKIAAHCVFEPAGDGVQFTRTTSNNGRITTHDPIWTKKYFEDAYEELKTIRDGIKTLRPSLTVSFNLNGSHLVTNYFYRSLI
jgi:hypothetical protein